MGVIAQVDQCGLAMAHWKAAWPDASSCRGCILLHIPRNTGTTMMARMQQQSLPGRAHHGGGCSPHTCSRKVLRHGRTCANWSAMQVVVPGPGGATMKRDFAFHACLGPEVSQADVMDLCGIHHLLDAALAGYHVTIFAYGQTGVPAQQVAVWDHCMCCSC